MNWKKKAVATACSVAVACASMSIMSVSAM